MIDMQNPTVAAPEDIKSEVTGIVQWANELVIQTADDYAAAANTLKGWKSIRKRIADFFSPMKKQADALKKSILDAERTLDGPAAQAEATVKMKLAAWDDAERARLEAERRKAQAILDEQARKEREKAEAIAKAERTKAEEAERKAEELRKAAEAAAGKDRAKLLAQAAKQEAKAEVQIERAEVAGQTAAMVVAPTVAVAAPATPKVEGLVMRKTWKAEITDLTAFLEWVAANKRWELLTVNTTALNAYAKAMGANATAPGVKFYQATSVAASGGK